MRQPTTRLQVSGHRFLVRRMCHALVRGDARMLDDPLRAQSLSLLVGAVLTVAGVVVCAVIAMVRPASDIGDAPVVVVRETGTLYVRVADTLHPVLNLASARLITGRADTPREVSQAAVDAQARGAVMGIPGAPQRLSPSLPAESVMLCDEDGRTTLIAGLSTPAVTPPSAPLLVTPRGAGPALTYLLYGGRRARVDLRHPAVVRALRLDGVTPRPVSAAVLAALPEAPAVVPPQIPDRGSPGPGPLRDHPVGTVVAVSGAHGQFVVLAGGLQRIGEVTADLIRYTDAHAGAAPATVAPDVLGSIPVVDTLPVTTYPERAGTASARVVCARWQARPDDAGIRSAVVVADATPASGAALAQADDTGPAVDRVAVSRGGVVLVRSVALGDEPAEGAGPLFLLADSGALFGVESPDAATRLGLDPPGSPVPWVFLAGLPRGADLSVRAASTVRDVVVAGS
ncbi:type VII secretion protein EccB [Mycolicibacterium sp. 018/SC-01/001]|uniref:type VII secretion protein EccB n=1 Tax=Mycolicibacterium sp. 018/SC-01/001 TaxID=2592069 RepID=UPI00117D07F6|nr:type VII secretion protein EccB [Mycolicibacterium sp. 018/SC-01/001]TRW81681.1 type VII secretion protein EccB [Mycolicibacterium sp. 018/SC-01/001]